MQSDLGNYILPSALYTMIELIPDDGWDNQISPGGSPRGFKNIRTTLLDHGLVAYSHGNTYIFLSASNSWSVFVSAEAQVQLCSIVGSENASVNYLAACVPYIGFLEKHALRTSSIPTSICIGTWRMSIFLKEEENKLVLQKAKNIASVREDLDSRVNSFCTMPCSFDELPASWSPGGPQRLLRYLLVLFPDPKDLDTIRWIVGNATVDPGTASKFLLLYGPGGTGKSTIIRSIEVLLRGCCSTIKPGTLTDTKDDINIDTAKAIASNRVLTAGEINLETNKLNLHNVKVMTGHDSISVPPIKVSTRCSIVAGCNDLPNPSIQKSWISTAIARRMVVVLMNVKTSLIPKRQMPDTVEDLQDFLLSCVHTRLTYPNMPISTTCVLYTILGDKYNEISHKIKISEEVTDQDMFDTNTQIEIYLELPLHSLGELASLVSCDAVKIVSSINFVKNICLVEEL